LVSFLFYYACPFWLSFLVFEGKKFTAEQIIGKLREAEVELARGKTMSEVVRKLTRGGQPAEVAGHVSAP